MTLACLQNKFQYSQGNTEKLCQRKEGRSRREEGKGEEKKKEGKYKGRKKGRKGREGKIGRKEEMFTVL